MIKLRNYFEFADAEGYPLEDSVAFSQVRHYMNWTTSAMGSALQVSSQTIKDWEQGRKKPGESTLKTLKLIFIMQRYAEKGNR
jgi:DNA-binding transcriptional regulator YiaG